MVTLREVARAAGVSPATASRALADPGSVSTERRERVRRTAESMGYRHAGRPDAEGAGGRRATVRRLGVIVPDMENPFFAGVTKGIQVRARAAGVSVVVADADEDSEVEADLVRQLDAHAEGLILCSPRMSDRALAGLTTRADLLLLNRESSGVPSVTIDNADGIRQALEHVHALGHRRIAYAGGPVGSWSDAERRRGLALAAPRLPDVDLVDLGHFPATFAGGVAAADLATAAGATAVLGHNDLVALGVLDRLRLRGMSVPGDVSVVGFDDVPSATQVSPALTTVSVPFRLLGRTAVDLLLDPARDRQAGEDDRPARRIPVSLVVRASTGAATRPAPRQNG